MKFIDETRAKIKAKTVTITAEAKVRYARARTEALRIRELAFSEEYNNYFAAVSFVPFVGWLIPLYLKKENGFCQEQAKDGFYLSLLFTSTALVFIFIGVFLSRDWRVVRLIDVVLVYITYLTYFGFCGYGAYASVKNRRAELVGRIPFIRELRGLIEL